MRGLAWHVAVLVIRVYLLVCGHGTHAAEQKKRQRRLFIVEKGSDSVAFYTPEGTRIASAPVGRMPHETVLSEDRKRAWVTDNGSMRFLDNVPGDNTVSIIDLQAMKVVGKIQLWNWRRPHAIDLDHRTGRLIVGFENPDRLLLIDRNRNLIGHFDVHGKTPHMATIAPGAQRAYVSNALSNNVTIIELSNGNSQLVPVGENPQGSVLSHDGKKLFVACDKYISVVDLQQYREVGRIGKGCNRIELSRDGSLLIYASNLNGVGFANPET